MGFQFNHVGGGTKTRRPIRLEMCYDPECHEPECELVNKENKWEDTSLEELQKFIAAENDRLESEDTFAEEDIIVRMHYEFSPNITIIDTPGALACTFFSVGCCACCCRAQVALQQLFLLRIYRPHGRI